MEWFKKSFENEPGNPDSGAITAFASVCFLFILSVIYLVWQIKLPDSMIYGFFALAGGGVGAKTFNDIKKQKNDKSV